jgi:23S rRNA (cytidine1920-2'-O)/16S rRNA (cytidine1409-2'-O)-methyltransferase
VQVVERTNVRSLTTDQLGRPDRPFTLTAADLSFISLARVARALVALTTGGHLVVLIKPQFEAGRIEASRGRGVIVDPEVWRRVLVETVGAFDAAGAAMMGLMVSPLLGARGNVEFLAHLVADPHAQGPPAAGSVDLAVDAGARLRARAAGRGGNR